MSVDVVKLRSYHKLLPLLRGLPPAPPAPRDLEALARDAAPIIRPPSDRRVLTDAAYYTRWRDRDNQRRAK